MRRPLIPFSTLCWRAARSVSSSPGSHSFLRIRANASALSPSQRGLAGREPERDAALALAPVHVSGDDHALPLAPGRDVVVVGDVHLDPAERVDQVGEAVEVDDHQVVDRDAEEVLDGVDRRGGVAVGAVGVARQRGVDLLRAAVGDRREGVARDRELAERGQRRVQDHDRVGARRPLALGAAGVLLPVPAAVAAEDEDVLAGQHVGAALERLLGRVVQLALLVLGRDREGEEADQEPGRDPDQDPAQPAGARRRRRESRSRRPPPPPPLVSRRSFAMSGLPRRSRSPGRDL